MSTTTMQSVLHSFSYCLDYLRDQVAGLTSVEMVAQPHGIPNHPAWVIGHLTYSCQLLGEVLGLPPWLPDDWAARFGTGSTPRADPKMYDSKEDALARLADAQRRVTHAVEQLTDDFLAQPFPDESYREVFPTMRHALTQVLVGHTANHIGQLTVWRRVMRFPPLGRSFE